MNTSDRDKVREAIKAVMARLPFDARSAADPMWPDYCEHLANEVHAYLDPMRCPYCGNRTDSYVCQRSHP